jgi:exopolyphosphatase/guanosine-5'-triphosphate,3'-diphosphate pyrophosphatase
MTNAKQPSTGKKIAVMDLGTNTFHLLIAEGTTDNYTEIVHEHIAVKLGEGGINHGLIQPEAFKRGIATMQDFAAKIQANNVSEVRAIATSALRSARNGADFIKEVETNTGIKIEIINGDSEAGFIYRGIQAAGCQLLVNLLGR